MCGAGLLGTPDEVQELGACARVLAKRAEHAGGDQLPSGFLYAAHLHTEVARLDDDTDTLRQQGSAESFRNLFGHAFLELKPVSEDADQPRDLAQAHHLSPRQVSDVAGAEKGQHMVLAEAVERDVLDDDHLVIVLVEHGVGYHLLGWLSVPVGELAQRLRNPLRRRLQTWALRILAQLHQKRLDQVGNRVAQPRLALRHSRMLTQL